jgi:hypothetical protein
MTTCISSIGNVWNREIRTAEVPSRGIGEGGNGAAGAAETIIGEVDKRDGVAGVAGAGQVSSGEVGAGVVGGRG